MTIRTDVGTDALLWERLGLRTIGQVEQPHVRPWSTVLRVPTAVADRLRLLAERL